MPSFILNAGASLLLCQAPPAAQSIDSAWYLLAQPAVQRELRMAPPDTARVAEAIRAAEADLAKRDRRTIAARAISHNGMVMELAQPALRKIGEGLPEPQRKRLREITLQQQGPWVLSTPGVREALRVSQETARIIALDQELINVHEARRRLAYAKRTHAPMVNAKGGQVPAETPAIRRMERERDAKLWRSLRRHLTKQQNGRLDALRGRPFTFIAR